MRPEWFAQDEPETPKQRARKIVDNWMGKHAVVLKKRAYESLVKEMLKSERGRK
jgi:hypothetical protein